MTSLKVRFLRGERLLSSAVRMVVFPITHRSPRPFTWGGAIALRGVPPTELAAAAVTNELLVELGEEQGGGRFPIVVQRQLDGLLAQFRGVGPRPPGIW
jgi:hypothetical protein